MSIEANMNLQPVVWNGEVYNSAAARANSNPTSSSLKRLEDERDTRGKKGEASGEQNNPGAPLMTRCRSFSRLYCVTRSGNVSTTAMCCGTHTWLICVWRAHPRTRAAGVSNSICHRAGSASQNSTEQYRTECTSPAACSSHEQAQRVQLLQVAGIWNYWAAATTAPHLFHMLSQLHRHHRRHTMRLGSGEMTVRPEKSTRLPDRLPRKRPCLPLSRCTKPLHMQRTGRQSECCHRVNLHEKFNAHEADHRIMLSRCQLWTRVSHECTISSLAHPPHVMQHSATLNKQTIVCPHTKLDSKSHSRRHARILPCLDGNSHAMHPRRAQLPVQERPTPSLKHPNTTPTAAAAPASGTAQAGRAAPS